LALLMSVDAMGGGVSLGRRNWGATRRAAWLRMERSPSCRNEGEERRFGDEWNDRKVRVGRLSRARRVSV
jgi:hypothetical protein